MPRQPRRSLERVVRAWTAFVCNSFQVLLKLGSISAQVNYVRRAFAHRSSRTVVPTVLPELVGHELVERTLIYHVGRIAESIADALCDTQGKSLGKLAHTDDAERTSTCTNLGQI